MNEQQLNDINAAFEKYRQGIFALQNDIQWWRSFLNTSIDSFQRGKDSEALMYESLFCVYDIDPSLNEGSLRAHNSFTTYLVGDLQTRKDQFFNWIINLSILKAYNSAEIFLLESIGIMYFETKQISPGNRKFMDLINSNIRNYLKETTIETDTTNNKHVINFIKDHSEDFIKFAAQLTRKKSKTTWNDFFVMFSILRNVVAHNGMIINQDTLNEIKSKAGDVFNSYFKLSDSKSLVPIQDQFINFLVFVNDFTINTVKFICDEKDMRFLKLYD